MTDINLIQQLFKAGITKQEFLDNCAKIEKENQTIFTQSITFAQIFDTVNKNGDDIIDAQELEEIKNLDTTDNINNESILSDRDLKIIYNKISGKIAEEIQEKTPQEMYQDAIKNGMTQEEFITNTAFQINTLEGMIQLRENSSQNIIKQFEKRISDIVLKSDVISNELKEEYTTIQDKIKKTENKKEEKIKQIKEQEEKIKQIKEEKELIELEIKNLKDSDDKDKIKNRNKELKKLGNKLTSENNKLQNLIDENNQIQTDNDKSTLTRITEKIKSKDKQTKNKIKQFEQKIESEEISAKSDIETYKQQINKLTLAQEYAISQIPQEEGVEEGYSTDYNDLDTSNFTYDSKALKQKWSSRAPWLSDEFFNKASAVAQRIGVDQDVLLGIMTSESSLKPDAVNKNSGATGLIQFMPSTAKSLGTTTQALKNMSAEEQLVYVEKFFKNVKKAAGFKSNEKIGAGTAYTLVFLPAYANRDILTKKGHKYYNANAGLDRNKDGLITKAELGQRVTKYIPK